MHGRPLDSNLRLLAAALATLCALAIAFAGRTAQGQRPGYPPSWLDEADLYSVFFIDEQRGWAVGDRGAIWHSQDGGRHWQRQPSPVAARLNSVAFADAQRGWIVGAAYEPLEPHSKAVVLHTTDGGRTWEHLPQPWMPGLRRCRFIDARHGWAVGDPSTTYPSGIFATEDGGQTWRVVTGAAPGESWTSLAVLSTNRPSSDGEPVGILATSDGGRVARVSGHTVQPPVASLPFPIQCASAGTQSLLVAGMAGQLRLSRDGGRSWHLPAGAEFIPRRLSFTAAAAHGANVWLAGTPGSTIFCSPDDGQTWRSAPTGQPLPIHDLFFLDAERGWAVGALGTILATVDGGQTWQIVRSPAADNNRAAILVFGLCAEDMPLELLAQQSAVHGWRVRVHVAGHPANTNFQSESDRLHDALLEVGVTGARIEPCVPLAPSGIPLEPAELLARQPPWQEGPWIDDLVAQLTMAIRTWRPDVVVAACRQEPSRRLFLQAVEDAVELAAEPQAADVDGLVGPWSVARVFIEDGAESVEHDEREQESSGARVIVRSEQLSASTGQTVGQLAHAARMRLGRGHDILPARFVPSPNSPQPLDGPSITDLLAGLPAAGKRGHRRASTPASSRLSELSAMAQHQALVSRLIHHADSASTLLQITQLTRGLPDEWAAELLLVLGHQQAQRGLHVGANDSMQSILRTYPDQPASWPASRWLRRYYSSAEYRTHFSARSSPIDHDSAAVELPTERPVLPGGAGELSNAQQVRERLRAENAARRGALRSRRAAEGSISPLDSSAPLADSSEPLTSDASSAFETNSGVESNSGVEPASLAHHAANSAERAALAIQEAGNRSSQAGVRRAGSANLASHTVPVPRPAEMTHVARRRAWEQVSEFIRTRWSLWYAEPEYRLATAAGWRVWGEPTKAILEYRKLLASQHNDQVVQIAKAELALAGVAPQSPKAMIRCPTAPERPRLDGDLSDALWGHAATAVLASTESPSWPESKVLLAWDQQFLFVAAVCPTSGRRAEPTVSDMPARRRRDMEMGQRDRVRLMLDVDRDYDTAWTLVVGRDGSVVDALDDHESWDPTWYVATAEQDEQWTIELAIPLAELDPAGITPGHVWHVLFERIIPGHALQSWSGRPTMDPNLLQEGYLLFQP